MDAKELRIDALRRVVDQIFDFIQRDLNISSIKIDRNFYWSIPEEILFDVAEKPPTSLDVGSLIDDYEFVLEASRDRDQALPLTLLHVVPLLREIALKAPNFKLTES